MKSGALSLNYWVFILNAGSPAFKQNRCNMRSGGRSPQ
jgi:hypothetical protein